MNYYPAYSGVGGSLPTGTYEATIRSSNIDMGANAHYRFLDTTRVPNNNTGTYTFPVGDTGNTVDLEEDNTIRYVNAGNVYEKGKTDGGTLGYANSVNRSYDSGAARSYSLSKGLYLVGVANGGASGTNYGTNSISVGTGATVRNSTTTSAVSRTDSSYNGFCGLRVALVEVTAASATITLTSSQGNHSTASCNTVVKIK